MDYPFYPPEESPSGLIIF